MTAPARDQVFISYAHRDARWLERLQIVLKPLTRNKTIAVWDDSKIQPGTQWKAEITKALASAKVAVLLVSQHFLASDFIAHDELPPLLQAAADGLTILWVAVGASLYKDTEIASYQAANNPAKPLNSLRRADADAELVKIAEKIKEAATWPLPKRVATAESAPEPSTFTNSVDMEFVRISTGTFLMGTADGGEWERPEHPVCISQSFYLGKYPVTQAQWATVMGNNPSVFKGHPNWPVENVSWEDVHVFIQTLKVREAGEDYRLPTEAEWEYACRAGSTTSYCFGDAPDQLGEYAWYRENAGGQPHPVGLRKPNVWGLYDMHGNVWEWVQDWYRLYPTDPLSASPGLERVDRGGSWVWDARFCRSATRGHLTPGHRAYDTGFRLLRAVL